MKAAARSTAHRSRRLAVTQWLLWTSRRPARRSVREEAGSGSGNDDGGDMVEAEAGVPGLGLGLGSCWVV